MPAIFISNPELKTKLYRLEVIKHVVTQKRLVLIHPNKIFSLNRLPKVKLNQRGRDHGLPTYNDVREAYGLARKQTFSEISNDADKQTALASVYESVVDIDLWVGGLNEDTIRGALVGELIKTVLVEQFTVLRN